MSTMTTHERQVINWAKAYARAVEKLLRRGDAYEAKAHHAEMMLRNAVADLVQMERMDKARKLLKESPVVETRKLRVLRGGKR